MFPIIFKYKIITIGGYGVMLGLGFYLAFLLLEREFKLRDINPELAYKILLLAIPCGIVGSKIFHILEHLDQFITDPVNMIFSGSGLSAYGGYVMAYILAVIMIKKNNERVLRVFDTASPSLALGYCFGRFGCHVAGDGCYGLKTMSFWGTPYPNGIVPSSMPVYPTPLFEVFVSFIAVGVLLKMRKMELKEGRLFFTFLIFSGLPRFLVEFIRLNPKLIAGLSQAQVIGILFILTGIAGWIYSGRKEAAA
ncbi:MAG: prolipoprotein diacylglyceryl transferase [Spirochaetes bacterium]|nr:prolipoprotein diacylglyceryl transferase [Spirochaetota bacterium]